MKKKKKDKLSPKGYLIRIPDQLIAALDKRIAERLDHPSRNALIREILAAALEDKDQH